MISLLGIGAALLSAVLWGSMFVPLRTKRRSDMLQVHAFMSIGIALSTLVLIPLAGLSFTFNSMGVLAGLVWSAANMLSIKAIERIGLSKAPPLWMSMVMVMSFLWGVLFFREPIASPFIGAAGIVLLIAGATVVSLAREERTALNVKGVMLALGAGALFGNLGAMYKYFQMTPGEFVTSMAAGILASGVLIFAMKRNHDYSLLKSSLAAGAMWNVASLSSLYALGALGLAISVPLTQLALLVSALWGLFYFREIRKGKMKVLAGAALLLAGAVLLAMAKG